MHIHTHKTVLFFVAAFIATATISCKNEQDQKPEPEPKPYEPLEINDIVIRSEFITNKDFPCPFNVILPSDYKTSGQKYPVLYLLHGIFDDNNAWQNKGDLVETTEDAVNSGLIAPFIMVLPCAYFTFYVDDLDLSAIPILNKFPKLKFESFFTKELQPFIENNFPVLTDREHTAIVGISMGGYGASYYAFNYPEKYSYCASLSGAVSGGDWTGITDKLPSVKDIFKKKNYDSKSFPFLPEYVMDCGKDDIICGEFNRITEDFLVEVNFPHVYRSFPGGHNWEYWKAAYQRMLPELAEHFGRQDSPRRK